MSLHKLKKLLKDYSPLMKESTEKTMEKVFRVRAAFAEVGSPNGTCKALTPSR